MMNEFVACIPYGEANKKSKETLARELNVSIDEIKRLLSVARKEYIILSTDDGSGYWRSNDAEELRRFIQKQHGRAYEYSRAIMIAYNEISNLEGECKK